MIAVENLDLVAMTRSAKGTVEEPGRNVSAKQGLNRSLQDAALGRLATWIGVKAESAGRRVWTVPAANTSRRCFKCGHTAKENRPSQARFCCVECSHVANAAVTGPTGPAAAAAQTLRHRPGPSGLTGVGAGAGPAPGTRPGPNHETARSFSDRP